MILPQEISKRIEAEAKKAAMVIEYEDHDPGPSHSAKVEQTSRIDPIQKEFYIKGATEWAGKAEELAKVLGAVKNIASWIDKDEKQRNMIIERIETALAKYKEVTNG
jgi:hypothetical protein